MEWSDHLLDPTNQCPCNILTGRDGVEGEAVSFSFPAASPDLESLTRGRDHDASFHGIDPSSGAPQPPTPRCPYGLCPHAANAAQCLVRRAVVPPLAGGGGSPSALVPGSSSPQSFVVVFMLNM